MNPFKSLLEFSNGKWGIKEFGTPKEYIDFVESNFKIPGEYNFTDTDLWRSSCLNFITNKKYTNSHPKSEDYKTFWLTERRKCVQGIIINGIFIPGSYYFFLNYNPIYNKIENRQTFPDVFDGQYHLFLHIELAILNQQDVIGTKCRQRGISFCLVSLLCKELWFGQRSMCKIIAHEEEYVNGEWDILENYKDFLNSNTGWYRHFNPSEKLNWEQKVAVTEGTFEKKVTFKGNKSKIKGATTKKNMAKAVGGAAKFIYATEAGIYPNLSKVWGYVKDNLKLGGVKTGTFIAMGAIGELKDASDLQSMCFNPTAYGIRSIKDTFSGSNNDIGFFYPDEWNYTYMDPYTKEIVKCYDEHGNSDIELALKYITIEEEKAKAGGEQEYKMYKSQHPRTLQDAFDQRENNPFPTTLLKQIEQELILKKDIIVKLERDGSGKLKHKFVDDIPISTLYPRPDDDNRGAILIWEFPQVNPPLGLYYAGIDPIYNLDTSTSKSLMSITIYMADHERDGKYVEGYPVASYTGRHKRVTETYQICADLLEYYNAMAAVESNVKDFIEWMIRQGKRKYLLNRSQMIIISDMMPNSTIRDEIGVRMEGKFKTRCIEKVIRYLEQPIADAFNINTGESTTRYGAHKIKDKMLIQEFINWTPKLNTDRFVSFVLALVASESSTTKNFIVDIKGGYTKKPISAIKSIPSSFKTSMNTSSFKKLSSPFSKAK